MMVPNVRGWLKENLVGYGNESTPTQMLIIKLLFLPHRDFDDRGLFIIPQSKLREWGHSNESFHRVNNKYGFYREVVPFECKKSCARYEPSELTQQLWVDIAQDTSPVRLLRTEENLPKQDKVINIGGLNINGVVQMDMDRICHFINNFEHEDRKYKNTRLDAAYQLYRVGNNTTYGCGKIPLFYHQPNRGGPVYGTGLKLQNCPRETRTAALHGYIDVDMKNLHYTILNQWGDYPTINYYVNNTSKVREDVSNYLETSPLQTKKCLLSIIYGATKGGSVKRHAVPRTLQSSEKAQAFWELPIIKNLVDETKQAYKSRGYTNKTLSLELQRIQQSFLCSIVQGQTVVVPMHDGAVLHIEIDTNEAEKRIKDKFGYDVVIKQERINYDTFFYNKRN